ncbi:MAG: ankyrin repeat domain-containing protein [Chloroflexi bacterium]|nr:ankyrin repeat domain-containing protein [Chloroflexota bacterium]
MLVLPPTDPLTLKLAAAVKTGDVATLQELLDGRPELANARLEGPRGRQRTPLQLVTDWPGYFPNGPEVARLLLARGGDPNDPGDAQGEWRETPLHWAASSDDVEVAEVLIDGGADVEAPQGSIGTPLANAVGYACWNVARLLVARGARADLLWVAAGVGLTARVRELLDGATAEQVSQALYHACSGGHRRTAELLLASGADVTYSPQYANGSTPLQAAESRGTGREALITWLRENRAASS